MKPIYTFLISVLILLGVGCKEKKSEQHNHDGQTVIELNEGKRWTANVETTQGIQSMIIMTNAYLANPSPDVKLLKENLTAELTGIFKKCTMKGESHDQLHNYLLPFKEKLEALSNSDDVEKVEEIKQYLETYKNYFE